MKILFLLLPLLQFAVSELQSEADDRGLFWHITDMHWDPTYATSGLSCNEDTPARGEWGNYLCDSPWKLINSSIHAMRNIQPQPDFLIWTGDDTPHIWDDDIVSPTVVRDIISNITTALENVWNDTAIFSALGNHDWSPKNQLPAYPDPLYDDIADMWQRWLPTQQAKHTFTKGGYYAHDMSDRITMMVLNTNLYYSNNYETSEMPDPANQMQWLYDEMQRARYEGRKVIVIGHVPPGKFEKHRNYDWFYPQYNDMLIFQLKKFSDVIGSIHMAHHHTDSFRLLAEWDYEGPRDVVGSILLGPAVAPWETTLDGVMGGRGNNPSIRLVEYNRTDGTVLDVYQYMLNLTRANIEGKDVWELAYRATEYYNVSDFSTRSLLSLAQQFLLNATMFERYYQANSVLYDPEEVWDEETRWVHYCAITALQYDGYDRCYWAQASAHSIHSSFILLLISSITTTALMLAA